MVTVNDFSQIDRYTWELGADTREDMRVPARIISSQSMLEAAVKDRTAEQLMNMATLPGAYRFAVALPDAHQGYGFCIGGVLATRMTDGVVSPGGVGYDINCGVRLLRSSISKDQIQPHMQRLMTEIYKRCPAGLGKGSKIKLSDSQLDHVLVDGASWAVQNGYGYRDDLIHTEDGGCIKNARPSVISQRARQRGKPQLGSLGSGNHFIEVGYVEQIHDPTVADAFGLAEGQVVVQVHSGSRGLGHQVASDYVRQFQSAIHKFNITLPDRELVCAPIESQEGSSYLAAMACAANYAFANRQILTAFVREAFDSILRQTFGDDTMLNQVYDVAHNIAKIEFHNVDGVQEQLCIHRKGATRSFGSETIKATGTLAEFPPAYQASGQPVLVPGSMGTGSWVMVGCDQSTDLSFGSCCHGAGRRMSRSKAKRTIWGSDLKQELEDSGIIVRAKSMAGLAEEAPAAYKDVDIVVEVAHVSGLARRVARIVPIGVIKG